MTRPLPRPSTRRRSNPGEVETRRRRPRADDRPVAGEFEAEESLSPRRRRRGRSWLWAALAGAVLIAALAVGAWLFLGPTTAERHPAARTVQEMLELRRSQETTAAPYERYFESTSIAGDLAAAAAREKQAKTDSVPGWDRPYVSSASSTDATVVVVWHREPSFSEWPVASLFLMHLSEEQWRVRNASTVTSEAVPPQMK